MGCTQSVTLSPEVRRTIQMEAVQVHLKKCGATRAEAEQLYAIYDASDLSKDGFLQRSEFERLLKLPKMADDSSQGFRSRLWDLFDANNDNSVSFSEVVVWGFRNLTCAKYSLITLAFALLDVDGSGAIDPREISQVQEEIEEDPIFSAALQAKRTADGPRLAKAKSKEELKMNEHKFAQFAIKYPAILYPASIIQEELRERLGGGSWWRTLTAKRISSHAVQECREWVAALQKRAKEAGDFAFALKIAKEGGYELGSEIEVAEIRAEWIKHFHPSASSKSVTDSKSPTPTPRLANRAPSKLQGIDGDEVKGSSFANNKGPPKASKQASAKVMPR